MFLADERFSRANLVFTWRAVTIMEASLVEMLRAHFRGAIAEIIRSRLEDDCSEWDNPLVNLVRRIIRSDMVSSRSITAVKNAANNAVLSDDVVRRIAEDFIWSDGLLKLIAVFVKNDMFHDVQAMLTEKWFLHSQVRILTGEGESYPSQHIPHFERKDETDSTIETSNTDETHGESHVRRPRRDKMGSRRESCTDDEPFSSDWSGSRDDIASLLHVIRPANSILTDALDYLTCRLVTEIKGITIYLHNASPRCRKGFRSR